MNPSSVCFAVELVLAVGCGGSSAVIGGGAAAEGDGGSLLPTGTCSFQLADGTGMVDSGTGAADMDGSGNLIVTCAGFAVGDAGQATLTLNIGNGTYDGMGTYNIDKSLSHGDVTCAAGANDSFRLHGTSAGCVVTS